MNAVFDVNCFHCAKVSSYGPEQLLIPVRCPHCREMFIASESPTDAAGNRPARPAEVTAVGPLMGQIGRYEIRKIRGSGAHGLVYQAWDPQLARWVAVKVPQFGPDDEQRTRRFLTEAQSAARLRHPRIVAIFDSGLCLGRPYLACEFVDGETLADRMASRKLSRRDAVRITWELAEALYAAHQADIIHRDVKPSNVMLDRQGRARLMDFGLAKRLDQESTLTQDGTVMGTPAYLSPEQARGDSTKIGPASDQFTLACVLFELLTGRKPFEGGTLAVVRKIASEPAPTLRSIDPSQDPRLEAILQRALNPKPEKRYPSIQHFGRDLLAWWKATSDHATPVTPGVRSARIPLGSGRAMTLGCSAVITLLIIVGIGASRFLLPVKQAGVPQPPVVTPSEQQATSDLLAADPPMELSPDRKPIVDPSINPAVIAQTEVEPPVDALVPANGGTPPVPADPLAEVTAPETFPPVVAVPDPKGVEQLADLLQTMLTRGLKSNREADVKASDEAYTQALKLASKEPRIAYARGLVLKKRAKTTEALQQFEQARMIGGYPFLPAYQTIMYHHSAVAEYAASAESLLQLLKDLNASTAAWPDEVMRKKAYFWTGQMAGLHQTKGMIPSSSRAAQSKPAFDKRADELKAAVPPAYLDVYLAGFDHALITANEALGNAEVVEQLRDQKLRDDTQAQLQATNEELARIEEKKVGIEQQLKEKRDLLESQAKGLREQFAVLKGQYDQLEIDAAPAAQDLIDAELEVQQAAALQPIPDADGNIDPVANENFLRRQATALYRRSVAYERMQGYYARYEMIMRKVQQCNSQYARVDLEFRKLTGGALAQLGQLNQNARMAQMRQRKLEQKVPKDLSKQQALKESLKELRDEFLARDLRQEAEWIRQSLPIASPGER